eukprot:14853830-Heterocapsa_arctica.AAC.1
MAQRATKVAALISVAAAGGLLFVQPTGTPGLAVEGRSLTADTWRPEAATGSLAEEGSSASFGGLFAGLALGLV